MGKLVCVKWYPRNNDEAFLFKIGKIKPKKLICEEIVDPKNHKGTLVYTYTEDNIGDIHSESKWIMSHNYIEIDPFGNELDRVFECSPCLNIHKNTAKITLEQIECPFTMNYQESIELTEDKRSVQLIMSDAETDNYAKAQKLVTLLLDRVMCINDEDEDYDGSFSTKPYALFYDVIINLIKKLDMSVYVANVKQITVLPSLTESVIF